MSSALLSNLQAVQDEYDATVREDIELFRRQAQKLLNGEMTEDEFRPCRLRRGIYSQRQTGVQMIRTKVPGGLLTAGQMRQLAQVADVYGGGKGHLTTRQNMQYHFVPLAQVADLLHMLADVRLTTREACYNTVRNVRQRRAHHRMTPAHHVEARAAREDVGAVSYTHLTLPTIYSV